MSDELERILHKLNLIHEQNTQTHKNQEIIMATLTGLETAIGELETNSQALIAAVGTLKEGQVTQEQLDAQTARVQAVDTQIKDATPA